MSANEGPFHHIVPAVELPRLFPLGDLRAVTRRGKEGRDAGAAGANAFGEGPLRIELDGQLAGEILPHELLVLANVGADHLADLPRVRAARRGRRRRCRHCSRSTVRFFTPAIADRLDERRGNPAQAEATRHDGHSIMQQSHPALILRHGRSCLPPSNSGSYVWPMPQLIFDHARAPAGRRWKHFARLLGVGDRPIVLRT